jgi:hypothetical protein
MALIREDMVYRAQDLYKKTVSESTWNNISKLMKHNPVVFESMINSMGARSSISGKIDVDFIDSMFTPSNLSKMMTDAGLVKSGKYTAKQVSEMSESAIAVTHFDNWSIRFPYNSEPITPGIKLSPAPVFYKYNALKTKNDFIAARNELMESMGVKYDTEIEGFAVTNPELTKRFLSKFSSTVYYRQQSVPDEQIARIHIENMLLDMRNTFHGGPNTYNEELFDLVKSKYAEIEIFRAEEYWSIEAMLTTKEGKSFTSRLASLDGKKIEKIRHAGFGNYIHLVNDQLVDQDGCPANIYKITPSDIFQILEEDK